MRSSTGGRLRRLLLLGAVVWPGIAGVARQQRNGPRLRKRPRARVVCGRHRRLIEWLLLKTPNSRCRPTAAAAKLATKGSNVAHCSHPIRGFERQQCSESSRSRPGGVGVPIKKNLSAGQRPMDQTADAVVVRGRSDLVDAGRCES